MTKNSKPPTIAVLSDATKSKLAFWPRKNQSQSTANGTTDRSDSASPERPQPNASREVPMPDEVARFKESALGNRRLQRIAINSIIVPEDRARGSVDREMVERLADSIALEGLLQPVLLTPSKRFPQTFILVEGAVRLEAVMYNGETTILAFVLDAERPHCQAHKATHCRIEALDRSEPKPT